MEAKTTTQRSAAHRQRQREKITRYEGALKRIADLGKPLSTAYARTLAEQALDPNPELDIKIW